MATTFETDPESGIRFMRAGGNDGLLQSVTPQGRLPGERLTVAIVSQNPHARRGEVNLGALHSTSPRASRLHRTCVRGHLREDGDARGRTP